MRNYVVLGEWNAICPVCGFKKKSGMMRKRWDSVMVCTKCWDPRPVPDSLAVKMDKQEVPWTAPKQEPVFVSDASVTASDRSNLNGN